MANLMQFDLVSPERRLASLKASSVQLPASEGDMTAMPNHAPTITTLRPGLMTVVGEDETLEFAVTGGFAEISAEGTTVLAERAFPKGAEATRALEQELDAAKASAGSAEASDKDDADKLVADFERLLADIG